MSPLDRLRFFPNPNCTPFGGYTYLQKVIEGQYILLSSHSWEGLAGVVMQFRIQNGIEVGDPLREVTEDYCKRYPSGCADRNPGNVPPPFPSRMEPMPFRVAQWLRQVTESFTADGREPVTDAQKTATAAACAGCPKQVDWGCMTCGSLAQHLSFASYAVRNGQDVPNHAELKGCSLFGLDTRTLPFVGPKNRPVPPADSVAEAPAHCPFASKTNT